MQYDDELYGKVEIPEPLLLDLIASDALQRRKKISQHGINRVESRYTWKRYADRLMTLSCMYGFWKDVSNLQREETRTYIEIIHALQFRRLAGGVSH